MNENRNQIIHVQTPPRHVADAEGFETAFPASGQEDESRLDGVHVKAMVGEVWAALTQRFLHHRQLLFFALRPEGRTLWKSRLRPARCPCAHARIGSRRQ